jgi:NAD(P)-dependent dehydrogenase (short-subunit alcohol dehydrogenase family)
LVTRPVPESDRHHCFAKGARIIVNVDGQAAEKAAQEIDAGRSCPSVAGEHLQKDEVRQCSKGRSVGHQHPVNNAGTGAHHYNQNMRRAWEYVSVNLNGAFYCCQAVIPGMIDKGGGKIVNIASLAASRMSKLGGADYTASKYGLVGFSHHLAFELAAYKINVNTVCPGATLTPLVFQRPPSSSERSANQSSWTMGSSEDIAEAVLFSRHRSAMITGVVGRGRRQLLGIAADYRKTWLAGRNSRSQCKRYLRRDEHIVRSKRIQRWEEAVGYWRPGSCPVRIWCGIVGLIRKICDPGRSRRSVTALSTVVYPNPWFGDNHGCGGVLRWKVL